MPRPNELSGMGRINAGPPGLVAGGRAARMRTWTSGRAPTSRLGLSLILPVLGGLIWFAASTISDVVDGGPTFDAATYVGTIVVTAVVGAVLGRSTVDDFALAVGAGLGLVVSSLGLNVRPEHHPVGDTLTAAVISGFLVLLAIPVARVLLRRWLPQR